LVEVLSHVAARATTFLVFGSRVNFVRSFFLSFNLMQSVRTALATQRRKNYGFNLMQSYTTDNIYRLIAYILATLWLYLPPQFIYLNLLRSTRPPCFYWTITYPYLLAFSFQVHTFSLKSNPLVCVRIVLQHIFGNHFPVLDVL